MDLIENLEGEVWREIEGYMGYQVSNMGRIKSFKRRNTIILQTFYNNKGYERVALCMNGKGRYFLVSRIVAEAFCQKPDDECDTVDHIDGNKQNNTASNLRWMTLSDNIKAYYENLQEAQNNEFIQIF